MIIHSAGNQSQHMGRIPVCVCVCALRCKWYTAIHVHVQAEGVLDYVLNGPCNHSFYNMHILALFNLSI